jgi:predicted ATP-grasp superfamily ATP-dependent carboligase
MLQNQFPGARSATLYQAVDRTPGIVDVNVTQSETEVWHNLKAVISAEGAKVQYIAWQNVRPENQRPCPISGS